MTDTPDDLPSPDEFRRKMAHVDREFADARRSLLALCAEDNQALGALFGDPATGPTFSPTPRSSRISPMPP
jgi:hypothetical protein